MEPLPPQVGTPADNSTDAQALLEAAMNAARASDSERAFELLKRSVAASHFNPTAHYLLGADYAQRERYGDAVLHMTTAIEQAPEQWTARLQLGLLWLTLANPTTALSTLQPLVDLPKGDALRSFGEALVALCRDELSTAAQALMEGLLIGTENAALAADMQRLLTAVQEKLGHSADSAPVASDAGPLVSHDMAISAYTGRRSGG